MKSHFSVAFSLSIFLTAPGAFSYDVSCGALFDPVPPTSLEWIRARNHEVNAVVKQSANYSFIAKRLRDSIPDFKIAKAVRLNADSRLQLWRTGFGKADQLALIENGKIEIIDWSGFDVRNGTERIEGIFPAPGGKTVVITVEQAGTIDHFEVIVIDVATRKVKWGAMYASTSTISWLNENEFFYQENTETSNRLRTVNVATGVWGQYPGFRFDVRRGNLTLLKSHSYWRVVDNHWWMVHLPAAFELADIVGRQGSTVFLRNDGGNGEIIEATADTVGHAKVRVLVASIPDRYLVSANLNHGTITAHYRWGPRHWLRLYKVDGTRDVTVELPAFGVLERMTWNHSTEKLDVAMSSPVSKRKKFTYDARSGRWDRTSFADELLRDHDGLRYVSEFTEIPSTDGALVPTLIVRRNDVQPTGDHPSLVRVYGGFGIDGYADDGYSIMPHEFLKRGGILVAPMVRGGNEFGPAWHKPFRGAGKMRTIEDVISVGRWLTANRWSRPDKIALLGSSNGGFIAAASALLAPHVFGDVYAIAGVYEMLRRRDFDTRFNIGWIHEYGDETNFENDYAWLNAMSPADLARRLKSSPTTRFFVLVGREDTRVNPEHSYRFAKALLATRTETSQVLMYDISNTGHFIAASDFDNPINWRANGVLWSLIFDRARFVLP